MREIPLEGIWLNVGTSVKAFVREVDDRAALECGHYLLLPRSPQVVSPQTTGSRV